MNSWVRIGGRLHNIHLASGPSLSIEHGQRGGEDDGEDQHCGVFYVGAALFWIR
jgi:hypothetical protein